jgi:cell division protein FtsW
MRLFRRILPKGSDRKPDYFFLAAVFLLTIAGLAILTSAASDLGKIRFNDSYYYLKHQVIFGVLFGAIGFFIAYNLSYKRYKNWALWLLLANMALLVLVFTPLGHRAGGSARWLTFDPVTFQPAEFLKLSFVIYTAAFFSDGKLNRAKNIKRGVLPFFALAGAMALLLIAQPATSTVVILLAAGIAIYFLSGAKWKHLFMIMGVGALGLVILVSLTSYRLARIKGFFDHSTDTQGTNYQLNQSLIALGSGGLFGQGYGQSTAKVNYLPEAVNDSIFAVVGQELGFVGTASLLTLFGILIFRMFWLAKESKDRFGRLILVGFATIIAFQSVVNIGSITGLLPLTGVPLPFISYGGTALAVFLTMSGIATNISKSA